MEKKSENQPEQILEKRILVTNNKSISIQEGKEIDILINGEVHQFEAGVESAQKLAFANFKKREFYKTFLQSHFENLVILTGAGTSVGWGGKTMKDLWDIVETKISSVELEKLCKAIGFISEEANFANLTDKEKDLEKLLSRANIAKEFIKEYKESPIDIDSIVAQLESHIQGECKFSLPDDSPHGQFLNKIVNRKLKDPRVKLFTLNYDTLFEKAAVKGNFTVIDGFSFSSPRTLSGRNFDYDIVYREKSRIKEEESFIPKVFHLYKPHGSINWEQDINTDSIIINDDTKKPLMIYPKDSKYENSYEQPFFEMMSRFQKNLRSDNVLLICVGFSFNDKHIITAIKEAVAQNPSFRLLIVNRTIRENEALKWFIKKAQDQYNVTIVAEEFKDFVENYPASLIYTETSDNNNSIQNEQSTTI